MYLFNSFRSVLEHLLCARHYARLNHDFWVSILFQKDLLVNLHKCCERKERGYKDSEKLLLKRNLRRGWSYWMGHGASLGRARGCAVLGDPTPWFWIFLWLHLYFLGIWSYLCSEIIAFNVIYWKPAIIVMFPAIAESLLWKMSHEKVPSVVALPLTVLWYVALVGLGMYYYSWDCVSKRPP